MTWAGVLSVGLVATMLVVACGGPEDTGIGEVTVLAAASLTDAFEAMAEDLEAEHEGLDIVFNFAGSQALATQIVEGAAAEVFASANNIQMDVVVDGERADGEPQTFTTNRLAIAVEPANPKGIDSLEDLAADDVVLVMAAPDVPAGALAATALEEAGVEVTPASLEVDVRAVLSRVELGEADAGLVYASDIVAAGDGVEGVTIPDDANVSSSYPIVVLADAPNADGAQAFVDFVLSEEGQAALEEFGFTGT